MLLRYLLKEGRKRSAGGLSSSGGGSMNAALATAPLVLLAVLAKVGFAVAPTRYVVAGSGARAANIR